MADVEFTVRSGVGLLRLNRPEKLNAITYEMIDEIEDVVRRADADPQVQALVVTGTGRAFSAGTDLGRLEGDRQARTRNRPDRGQLSDDAPHHGCSPASRSRPSPRSTELPSESGSRSRCSAT